MQSRLNCTHDFHGAFKDGEGGADRSLGIHVSHLHIGKGGEAPTLIDDVIQEAIENRRRFFVRKERDVVADAATRHIDIAKLTRCDGRIVAFDAKTTRLKAARKVGQSACIHQLPQDAGRTLCQPTNEVDKAEGIETDPRQIAVMHKMIPLLFKRVRFFPVTANRQDLSRTLVDGHHIGQCDSSGGTVFILIFKTRKIKINQHFNDLIPTVALSTRRYSRQFILFGLNVARDVDRIS